MTRAEAIEAHMKPVDLPDGEFAGALIEHGYGTWAAYDPSGERIAEVATEADARNALLVAAHLRSLGALADYTARNEYPALTWVGYSLPGDVDFEAFEGWEGANAHENRLRSTLRPDSVWRLTLRPICDLDSIELAEWVDECLWDIVPNPPGE